MSRAPLYLFSLVALLALGFYLLLDVPPSRVSRHTQVRAPDPAARLSDPSPELRVEVREVPPPAPAPPPALAPVDDAPDEADAEPPYEPKEISLGQHRLSVRESTERLEVELLFRVRSRMSERRVRGLRRRLMQMAYFLSSQRLIDGMRAPGGIERFRADLEARARNLLRDDDFERLSFRGARWVEGAPRAPR